MGEALATLGAFLFLFAFLGLIHPRLAPSLGFLGGRGSYFLFYLVTGFLIGGISTELTPPPGPSVTRITVDISELDAQARAIPAYQYRKNLEAYGELLRLEPENERYQLKVEHYSQKLAQQTGQDPLELQRSVATARSFPEPTGLSDRSSTNTIRVLLWILAVFLAVMVFRGRRRRRGQRVPQYVPREPPPRDHSRTSRVSVKSVEPRSTHSGSDWIKQSRKCWMPPGNNKNVDGINIPGGMIYVGKEMDAVHGYQSDATLINPKLKLSSGWTTEEAGDIGYWPRYADIEPQERYQYLQWLAEGRRRPGAPLGYVFLFFYGLERRLLCDAAVDANAASEIPQILTEIRALRDIYGDAGSFYHYASNLIDFIEMRHSDWRAGGWSSPETNYEGFDVPFSVKVALGQAVNAGEPISTPLALAWTRSHPEIYLRTPAERCPEEFADLFKLRYAEKYGAGLKLKRNKTNLRLEYQPASSSIHETHRLELDELPDVTRLRAPQRKLQQLANGVQDELASYSRWVGKTDDRTSAAALAFLPPEMMRARMQGDTKELADWIESLLTKPEGTVVATQTLLERWPAGTDGKLTKKEATALAEFLAALGIGIEPDVRWGRTNPSRASHVALFRCDDANAEPTSHLNASSLLLQLGAAVAAADGVIAPEEERRLEKHLETSMDLDAHERRRLRGRMALLLQIPPSFSGVKKALEHIGDRDRQNIGQFVLGVAAADGNVDPEEVKVLTRIFKLLGFNQDALFAQLHDLALGTDEGPRTVIRRDAPQTGYGIPPQPDLERQGITLNPDRIAAIRTETQEVAGLLKTIFEGEPEMDPEESDLVSVEDADDDEGRDGSEESQGLAGLDVPHSAVVVGLEGMAECPRAKFNQIAAEQGLLPAGAIEVINEAAFDSCDEPLIEGEDPLEINDYAMQEMQV